MTKKCRACENTNFEMTEMEEYYEGIIPARCKCTVCGFEAYGWNEEACLDVVTGNEPFTVCTTGILDIEPVVCNIGALKTN